MAAKYDYDSVKDLKFYRNIGIIAHVDAGKTTTTERILFFTGKKHKVGEVHDGAAEMDFMKQERERGITIQSAATTTFWKPQEYRVSTDEIDKIKSELHRINIIDTPGHVDFTAEVERSLRVLDGAVVVFDGKIGTEPQTSKVWFQAEKYYVPRMCFINKLDGIGGDFYKSYDTIIKELSTKAIPIQLPIGSEHDFHGIIDLVNMEAHMYRDQEGKTIDITEIPADMLEKATLYHNKLIEAAADFDDALAEKYLAGEKIEVAELKAAIRKGVIQTSLFPVLAGASLANKGIQLMLDAVCDYLPSPTEKRFELKHEDETIEILQGEIPGTDPETDAEIKRTISSTEKFSALVFKIATDPHVGILSFFRVYSGELEAGTYTYNSSSDSKERVGRIVMMHANSREDVQKVKAGDIAAIVGLKSSRTGETICDPDAPIILESIEFPDPVVSLAIEPKTKSDLDKLSLALGKLTAEDPTFKARTDEETGQTIISGMGELHLDVKIRLLADDFGVGVSVGAPQVAYRETVLGKSNHRELLKKQSGGAGQFADIEMNIMPNEAGKGYEFVDSIKGGSIPREYIPSINKGFQEALKSGPLAGYPVVDVKAEIVDGSFHEVDSNTDTFRICAISGFKEAMKKANPILLEPIMKVFVTTPEEHVGAVTGYLSSKRGLPKGMNQRGPMREIVAEVPLAELFGYVGDLRNLTSGRALPTMEFSHYAQVPGGIQAQIVAKGK